MVGWFARKFDKWASGKQASEFIEFLKRLRAMDGEELGLVVALATDRRHILEADGHLVSDPTIYVAANPDFTFQLSRATIQHQKQGNLVLAAALMVWIHTLRAGTRLELRQYGRDMWRELQRGFPYVEQAALDAEHLFGKRLNVEGFNEFPKGLTPDPL